MAQTKISKDTDLHKEIANHTGYESLVHEKENGVQSLALLVSGVHCAACIQKIESTLQKHSYIKVARFNFSTSRLNLEWEGQPIQANDMVQQVEALGYPVHPFDTHFEKSASINEEKFLLLCLGVAGFAMGNIMLLSVGLWSTTIETMGMATRDLMHWVSALIALPTIIFSGRPFFRSAFKALASKHANMDVPISLALILATGMSLYETVNHGEHIYFDSAVMLMFFLLIGRYLDFRARRSAKNAATELMSNFSGFAFVVEGKKTKRIPIRDIKEGMIVAVAVGEKFPVDGTVVKGITTVDMSLITGETLPRKVALQDTVYAGTLNLSAPVQMTVTKAVEDTLLSDVIKLMEEAEQGQAKYVRLSDRVAQFYTPVVHFLAITAFLSWWIFIGVSWQEALMVAVTVLIITCPCALGLAVPVVQVLATGRLMKKGILVKSGDALERLAQIDIALFDKTGTLTHGKPVLDGKYNQDNLKLVASLAMHSQHPLSQAIVKEYVGDIFEIDKVKEHPGQGLEGYYQGKLVRLGNRAWCGDKKQGQDKEGLEFWFCHDDKLPVVFEFSDALRDDAKQTLIEFQNKKIKTLLLSGDRKIEVTRIAQELNISEYYSEMTPPEKFKKLENLKNKGHSVLMVGDGLNDAPVLMGADISMAPGSAIDVAQNAADIIFMGEHLSPVIETYQTAVKAQKLVKQNFSFALLYNIVAVPLAFCGLITPLAAAVAMSCSSLFVITNSFRLNLKK